ncbi:MAG: prepilin-type N-terminal cleavage/methylation domain-containing protein [Deltaproteobacteria bacterium]|nr:prepilin-type N-terminal cleavage/methylation domain-containing protein [Deltaproteobacteria bacterium]
MKLGNKGFSLIELIIVIAVLGIGAAIATLNFNQWVRKANIEKQAKELLTDLNDARLQSVYTKKRHSVVFQPNSYVFKEYSSLNEDTEDGGRVITSKNVANQMTTLSGGSLADSIIEFDIRGFTSDWNTVRINPAYSGAAYDCIVVSNARTNLGKIEKSGSSDVCNQK